MTSGCVPLSAAVSQIEPGPHALRAERHRRGHLATAPDAAGREHRHVGRRPRRRPRARAPSRRRRRVWPPASVPCATIMSTPWFTWRSACCTVPTSAATLHAVLVREVDDVLRRRAERVHEQLDRVRERDLDLRSRALVRPPEQAAAGVLVVGQRRHVVLGEHLLDEVLVLLRDHVVELLGHALGIEVAALARRTSPA